MEKKRQDHVKYKKLSIQRITSKKLSRPIYRPIYR